MKKLLQNIDFFSAFSEEKLAELERICLLKKYEKDELIFYEGERSEYLHLLLKGSVKIYKSTPRGGEMVLHRFFPVCFLAEVALFEGIPYPASARFISRGELIKVHYPSLVEGFFGDKILVQKLLAGLSKKLIYMNDFVHEQMILTAEGKLAKLLCENPELFAQLRHNQLANLINMAPETFSRLLAKFRAEGLISAGREICVQDERALREMYES